MTERRYLIADEQGRELSLEVSWQELFEVNDPETMEEIAEIPVGETVTLGMCDRVRRLPDEESQLVDLGEVA